MLIFFLNKHHLFSKIHLFSQIDLLNYQPRSSNLSWYLKHDQQANVHMLFFFLRHWIIHHFPETKLLWTINKEIYTYFKKKERKKILFRNWHKIIHSMFKTLLESFSFLSMYFNGEFSAVVPKKSTTSRTAAARRAPAVQPVSSA